jgi:hypothetical protein
MTDLAAKRRYLRDENKKFTAKLQPVPIPPDYDTKQGAPLKAWRSRDFLVTLYDDPSGYKRLSILRTEIDFMGRWKDGIAWDDLQRLKNEAGFAHQWAVECYPEWAQVVNVANIRHLFLLPQRPPFGWFTP